MKKVLGMLAAICMLICVPIAANAAGEIGVTVNDQKINFRTAGNGK